VIRRFRIHGEFSRLEEAEPLAGADIAPGKRDEAVRGPGRTLLEHPHLGRPFGSHRADGLRSGCVERPVKGPPCMAIGRRDYDRLFAIMLKLRYSDQELATSPQADCLFEVQLSVPVVRQRLCSL